MTGRNLLWEIKLSIWHGSRLGLAHCGLSAISGSLLVFVINVLLEHRHTYSFMYNLWLLSNYSGRVKQLAQRLYGLQNLKYLQRGLLQKVS